MMKISILICSYQGSKYLAQCLASIVATVKCDYEIILDIEKERRGLQHTPSRYQEVWKKATGDYVVKSDDDILYFDGWLKTCIWFLDSFQSIGYISPLNHQRMFSLGKRDLYTEEPIHGDVRNCDTAPFLCGACWVFRRDLWEKVPYGNLEGIKTLDSNYGAAVRAAGLQPAYLRSILCSHLGTDRHGGVDIEGE